MYNPSIIFSIIIIVATAISTSTTRLQFLLALCHSHCGNKPLSPLLLLSLDLSVCS